MIEILVGPEKSFVPEELLNDGTLAPKYVGVGTRYEVCLGIYFIILQLVNFVSF